MNKLFKWIIAGVITGFGMALLMSLISASLGDSIWWIFPAAVIVGTISFNFLHVTGGFSD